MCFRWGYNFITPSWDIYRLVRINDVLVFFHAAYVEMTDLLREFNEPAVMDIKMGIRYVQHLCVTQNRGNLEVVGLASG